MSRLIDADALMKAMYHRAFETDGDTMWQSGCWVRYRAIEEVVKAQPTIEPEPEWIPVGERMPEEHEWLGTEKFGTTISNEVYVTFETPDGQRLAKHISFQNGKLSSVDEQRMKVWFKGAKPIAWKPLPKPWKGEG
jgi:hypothetical protein